MNHQEIIELLPWYANSTLSEDERKRVEMHLADCQECAQELASLSAVHNAVIELGDQTPAPSPRQFKRALAEIENYEQSKVRTGKRRVGGLHDRIATLWTAWWQATPVFGRALIAAQVILLIGLGTATFYQYNRRNVVYVTSSGPSGPGTGTRIVVRFNPDITEQEVRKTISDIDGTIAGGPSAQDLYTIQLKIPQGQAEDIERLPQKLRENRRVIRIAEKTQ